jgi:hypothetical protein
MHDGSTLIGVLVSSPVGKKPVAIDDVEEVAHAAGLGPDVVDFQ